MTQRNGREQSVAIFGDIEQFASELYPYRWLITVLAVVALALLASVAYRRGWHLAVARHKLRAALVVVPLLVVTVPLAYYLLSPLWTRTTVFEESPLAVAANDSVPGVAATTRTATSPAATAMAARASATETATTSSPTATSEPQPATAQEPTSTSEPDPTQATAEELEPTQEPVIEPTAEPTPALALEPTPEPAIEPAPEPTEAVFTPRLVSSGPLSGADEFHFAEGTALLIETTPGVYVLRLEDFSVRNGPDLFVYLAVSPEQFDDSAINLGDLRATDGSINYDVPAGTDISQYQGVVIWCRAFAVLFGTAPLYAS